MNRFVVFAGCLCLVSGVALQSRAGIAAETTHPAPQPVALDGIINPASDDTLAFTPDGNTVFFDRSQGKHKTIMVAHKVNGHWSAPQTAGFSGHWYDQDPALAPDGSYIVFSSDRPTTASAKQQFRTVNGKASAISDLWKTTRQGDGWGKPVWLGSVVNASHFLVSPSVAADGTLYFIQRGDDHEMHIYRSRVASGQYLAPERVALGNPATSTHDPAIAPDGSFMVFGYGKSAAGLGRLHIAFREGDHWSQPVDLGDAVNGVGPWGSHVMPDGHTLTFTGDTALYRVSLDSWLRKPQASM